MSPQSAADLLGLLQEHQFLEPRQQDELRRGTEFSTGPSRPLARHLIERGWLTPYQLNLLFQGRGTELVLGPYLILERLGEGGIGQVFKARHRRMQRVVALKLIRRELLTDPEVVSRFVREIQVVSRLSHPNVVHAYDAGPVGPAFFLAMEYVEGTDLARLVKQDGPLSVDDACAYLRQAALGLQHAHERGLVHRDIKPPNLMVQRRAVGSKEAPGVESVVKLLDLGLARLQRPVDGEKTSLLTPAGPVMLGTPDFLAPEQAIDFHGADIRADIYSLGCSLYYLLTGRPPFAGGSLTQKLLQHQQAEPPALDELRPDVPPALAAAARRMLAKEPRQRFQTPAEVADALTTALRQGVSPAEFLIPELDDRTICTELPNEVSKAVPVAPTRREPRRRRLAKAWVGLGFLLGICILGSLLLKSRDEVSSANSTPQPATTRTTPSAAAEFSRLQSGWRAAGPDREKMRPALVQFQQSFPGTPEAREVGRLLRELPSFLDRLTPDSIPAEQRQRWPAPELVAIWGELKGTAAAQGGAVFSADGRWLAAGGEEVGVQLWDVEKAALAATLPSRGRGTRALFTPDGHTLVVFGGRESTVDLWDITSLPPREKAVLKGYTHSVTGAAVSPDGKTLATTDGDVRLWELTASGVREAGRIERPADPVQSLAYSADGRLLALLGPLGKITLWDATPQPNAPRLEIEASGGDQVMLTFAPSGKSLVAAGQTGTASLHWIELKGSTARQIWGHKFGRVMSLSLAPDGQTVAATVGNGRLILFDSLTGFQRRVWYLPVLTHTIDVAPDGRHVAIACPGDAVAIMRISTPGK